MNLIEYMGKYGCRSLLLGLLILTIGTFILAFFGKFGTTLFIICLLGWISFGIYYVMNVAVSRPKAISNRYSIWIDDASKFDTYRNQCILDILFLIFIITILITLQTYNTRPYYYHILVIFAILSIILSALISKPNASQKKNILKSFALGLVVSLSIFKIYYLVGWDTWIHMISNKLLVETGAISSVFGKEASYPIQHVAIAIVELCTGLDVRIATIITFTISGILLSVLVYQIASKFFESRLAVIGLLLFITFTYTIYWIIIGIPTSYASLLYLPLIYVFYKILSTEKRREKNRWIVLYSFLFLIIIATHMFSTFIIAFIILAFYIASILNENKIHTKIFPLMVISLITVVIYWLLVNSGFEFFISLAESSLNAIAPTISPLSVEQYVNLNEPDYFQIIFISVWVPIVLCVFLIASYIGCKETQIVKNKRSFQYIWYLLIPYFTCLIFYAVIYLIYPAMIIRITGYISVFYVLTMTYILYYFINKKSGIISLRNIIVILLILSLICFMNISQPVISNDNTPWYTDTNVCYGFTWMEKIGSDTISSFVPIESDIYSDLAFQPISFSSTYWNMYSKSHVIPSIIKQNKQIDWFSLETYQGDYFIFRDILLTSPTQNSKKYGVTENERFVQLIQLPSTFKYYLDAKFNCLYDNKEIQLYYL